MTVQDAVRTAIKSAGITQADVSDRCGMSGQGAVSSALQGKGMRVKSLVLMLNACGYELIARSNNPSAKNVEILIEDEDSAEVIERYKRAEGQSADVQAESESETADDVSDIPGVDATQLEAMIRRIVSEEMRKQQ